MVRELYIKISPQVYVITAIMLLAIPFSWLFGWLLAVLIHELSHCLMLRICGINILSVHIGIDGVRLQTENLSDLQTILCSLAGPAGGLFLLLLADIYPQAAVCSVVLSIYNLLPVFPLDGGRALRGFSNILLPTHYAESVCLWVESITLLAIIIVGLVMTFRWKMGILPLGASALIAIRMQKIKISCKSRTNRVQ